MMARVFSVSIQRLYPCLSHNIDVFFVGPNWPKYTPSEKVSRVDGQLCVSDRPNILNKVLMQLHGGNMTVIPDDYRKEQIDFLVGNARVFQR
jgi:hypothetical protein